MSLSASAGMMDMNGNPIPHGMDLGTKLIEAGGYDIGDVTMHCAAKGYFIYGSTIYMCVKIRENVSKKELQAYTLADNKRQAKRLAAQNKWYKEWIQTEEGKTWQKEYRQKLKEKEAKGHK